MTEEKIKFHPNYKRTEFTCSKCNKKIVIESDYLTELQAKNVHKCKKEKK